MITYEIAQRIWAQLGDSFGKIEGADAKTIELAISELDERRKAALASLIECEELHAIMSAERAAKRYADAEDKLFGASEWYRDQKANLGAADEHHEGLVRRIRRLRIIVMNQVLDEYDKVHGLLVAASAAAREQLLLQTKHLDAGTAAE